MRGFIDVHNIETDKLMVIKVAKIQSIVDYGEEGRMITTENGQEFDCKETMNQLENKMHVAQGY